MPVERQKQSWKEKADDYKMFAGVKCLFVYWHAASYDCAGEKGVFAWPYCDIVNRFVFFFSTGDAIYPLTAGNRRINLPFLADKAGFLLFMKKR